MVSEGTQTIRIDSHEQLANLTTFAQEFMPATVPKLQHYAGERPIFDLFNIDKDISKELKVTAIPNPAPNEFTIVTKSGTDKLLNINVMDVSGRVLEKRSNVAANGTLYIGNKLPAGIYLIEVIQGTQKQRVKVVKK